MNKLSIVTCLIAAVGLSGCSKNPIYGEEGLFRDKNKDYQQAATVPRLQVPEHLDSSAIQDRLIIPDIGTVATQQEGDFEAPRPTFFYAEAGNDVVNMARQGKEKYIIVNEPPEEVWQKMVEFWSYNQMKLAIVDPQQGLMETTWIKDQQEESGFFTGLIKSVTFQDDTDNQLDKLRVRLARDENPDKTAIRMQHIRVDAEEENPQADWSQKDIDVSYKSDMMYALLHYLSKATESTTAVALQRKADTPLLTSQLGRDADKNPVMRVSGGIDSVWEAVELAMNKADMDVGSSNQDIGKFYLTYTTTTRFNEESKGGFWAFIKWLHSDREDITVDTGFLSDALGIESDEEEDRIKYSAKDTAAVDPNDLESKNGYKVWLGGQVIYVFETGDNAVLNEETGELEHTGYYQVKLSRRNTGVFVSVLNEEAAPANPIVAEEILWVIKEHLPG